MLDRLKPELSYARDYEHKKNVRYKSKLSKIEYQKGLDNHNY